MEPAVDYSKVRAFLYTLLIYFPLGLVGIVTIFVGNVVFGQLKHDLFTIVVGGSLVTFGVALVIIFFSEPFLKLFYLHEALNSKVNKPSLDVNSHLAQQAVGVKISPKYDIRDVANEIIKNECSVLGKPYCIRVAKVSGLNINDDGKVNSLERFADLEKLVASYAKAFGRPALFAAEVVLEKYPDLKFKTIYK